MKTKETKERRVNKNQTGEESIGEEWKEIKSKVREEGRIVSRK